MPAKPKKKTETKPTVDKIVTYRATSPDGLHQANGSTEKEALDRLKESMNHVS